MMKELTKEQVDTLDEICALQGGMREQIRDLREDVAAIQVGKSERLSALEERVAYLESAIRSGGKPAQSGSGMADREDNLPDIPDFDMTETPET